MGCFVPGCSTGGAGGLRSRWMLYHFDGMSFSSRRNFVRFLSVVLAAMPTSFEASPRRDPRKVRSRYERAAALSTEGGCYTAVEEEAMTRTLRLPRADGVLTPYTLPGGGDRSPRAGPARDARRRRGGVRGAVRVDRALRRPHHPDGEPRARRGGPDSGRLPEGLRPHPQPGARAGHHPLARRDVRSRAGGLLGLGGPRPRDRDAAGDRERARREDRRRQDLPPRSAA